MTLFVGLFANADSLSSRVEQAYEEGGYPSLYVFTSPVVSQTEGEQVDLLSLQREAPTAVSTFSIFLLEKNRII